MKKNIQGIAMKIWQQCLFGVIPAIVLLVNFYYRCQLLVLDIFSTLFYIFICLYIFYFLVAYGCMFICIDFMMAKYHLLNLKYRSSWFSHDFPTMGDHQRTSYIYHCSLGDWEITKLNETKNEQVIFNLLGKLL